MYTRVTFDALPSSSPVNNTVTQMLCYSHTYIHKHIHTCIHTYTHIYCSVLVGISTPYVTLRKEYAVVDEGTSNYHDVLCPPLAARPRPPPPPPPPTAGCIGISVPDLVAAECVPWSVQ